MKKTVYTHWKRPAVEKEHNSGEIVVDRAGYRPTAKIIEDMMIAGRNLVSWRAEQFDYQSPSDDDGFLDPTRGAYDLSDAANDMTAATQRLKEQEAKANALKASMAKQRAIEEAKRLLAESEPGGNGTSEAPGSN